MLRVSARAAARSAVRSSGSGSAAVVSVAAARHRGLHSQASSASCALARQAGVRFASSAASASPAAAPASSSKAAAPVGPVALFNKRIEKGQLVEDEHQRKIVTGPLEKMYRELEGYKREVKELPKEPVPGGWVSGDDLCDGGTARRGAVLWIATDAVSRRRSRASLAPSQCRRRMARA
jgi:hypothetical protein